MRVFITLLCAMPLTLILAGCTKSSPQGGSGASAVSSDASKEPGAATSPADVKDSSRTFTVSVPSSGTAVTQGEKAEVTIHVNRAANFGESVRLNVKAPDGISVTPSTATVPRDTTAVKVAVAAAADAPVGHASLEVTGTPETGAKVAVRMDLDVRRR